jgi:hypothetical protein
MKLETALGISNPSHEEDELKRTADELGLSYKALLRAYESGSLEALPDVDWKQMKNTESWGTTSLKDAERIADSYDKDWQSILKALKNKNEIEAPIVLYRNNEPPYLIAGNTRLMFMRAMKIRPKVFKIKL